MVDIAAGGAHTRTLERAIERAFDEVALVHRLMSFHEPDSDLSRLNAEAWRRPVCVHPYTHDVLRAARMIADATNGLFDCTIAPHLIRWGYLPDHGRAAGGDRPAGRYDDVECLARGRVRFLRPLRVDLGGIAKGFAVDRAVAALQAEGATVGCVNAGGDLRMFGDTAQPVYVRAPHRHDRMIPLEPLRDAAVATSCPSESRKRLRGVTVTPCVDPLARTPILARRSVSVFAPSCVVADALTKAVMIANDPDAPFLARFDAAAVILDASDGRN